jgi:hydroxyacylglutathione hydrolase
MEQMYHSVNQFRNLQSYTYVYCGHEYTEANARFALAMEPSNRALHQRAANVAGLTAKGAMTCPTTIAEELATNPFMRCDSPAIRQTLGMSQASDAAVFAELRSRKNSF